jgi:alginate O-acetyltransferase complex protein AlgI
MNFCTPEFLFFFVTVFAVYWGMSRPRVRFGFFLASGAYFLLATANLLWDLSPALPADVRTELLPADLGAAGAYWMTAIIFVVSGLAFWVGHHQARVWLLLTVSFFFYACFNKWLATIICITSVMDYAVARGLDTLQNQRARRLLLAMSLVVNLGLLVYFKYANFFLDSLAHALHAIGSEASLPWLSVILPIGISFYTFEAINYTIDVYRRRVPAEKNLGNFILFITFFPHLVAGPIVRARDFLPQIHRRKRFDWPRMQLGVQYLLMGLFKKLAIADRMGMNFVRPVFENPEAFGSGAVWLATIAYALQIYCDFSGYTDMALGCAHMLGYKLAQNFNMPYLARNISDFWRRWHISLSSWLRDYLFIPLGGSRGTNWQTCRNLMITMTLGGLWHGASWTFVIWGVLHGLYLIIHRSFRAFCEMRPRLDAVVQSLPGRSLSTGLTLFSVFIGWIFFCSAGLQQTKELEAAETAIKKGTPVHAVSYSALDTSVNMIGKLVIPTGGKGSPLHNRSLWYTVAAVVICHFLAQRGLWKRMAVRLPAPVMGFGYAVVLTLALLMAPAQGQTFIYFQF